MGWFSLVLLLSDQQRQIRISRRQITRGQKQKGKLPFLAQVSSLEAASMCVCACVFVSPYDILFVSACVCITSGQFDISSHYQHQKGKRLQGTAAITHTISKTRCYYASGVR